LAELTAAIFRDYFPGSWTAKTIKNGEFQREIVFNWPEAFGKFSALGTEEGMIVPPDRGALDNTKQVVIAGWHSDIRRWIQVWHNEFGGYGEIHWTSHEVKDGMTVLYGHCHESKQETDDRTDHIIMCEMFDQDNFKYTMRSFRKGLTEIVAKRIRTGKELKALLDKQVHKTMSFYELIKL
jgi:hypothetical protein